MMIEPSTVLLPFEMSGCELTSIGAPESMTMPEMLWLARKR